MIRALALRGLSATMLPLLRTMDAESAHDLTIRALAAFPLPACENSGSSLAVDAFGLTFPNPVGMAAGFDKNAEVPDALLALGFGFTEVGTLTPRPQSGNPKPRMFRLPDDEAVINRLGFNNGGHDAAFERLSARSRRAAVAHAAARKSPASASGEGAHHPRPSGEGGAGGLARPRAGPEALCRRGLVVCCLLFVICCLFVDC